MIEQIIKPEPDSQYRLVPCPCGGEPIYEKHKTASFPDGVWCVVCPACKRGTKKYYQARHDAQIEWNEGVK